MHHMDFRFSLYALHDYFFFLGNSGKNVLVFLKHVLFYIDSIDVFVCV